MSFSTLRRFTQYTLPTWWHAAIRILKSQQKKSSHSAYDHLQATFAWQGLMLLAHGDMSLVKRLIKAEHQLTPHLSVEQCADRALAKWQLDRR